MLYRALFPSDIFSEMERLHREVEQILEAGPSIRGTVRSGFSALNVGSTPHSVELYAFLPGIDPNKIEVTLEQGVLTISGERQDDLLTSQEKATIHIHERFSGHFRRVINLPDDVDPDSVDAKYADGVLHISLKREETAQPRRISIH